MGLLIRLLLLAVVKARANLPRAQHPRTHRKVWHAMIYRSTTCVNLT
uniref:Secreted protein n=1 Tax=Ciona intestinalis TaxID=7719 RepID=H2XV15_CIOIN